VTVEKDQPPSLQGIGKTVQEPHRLQKLLCWSSKEAIRRKRYRRGKTARKDNCADSDCEIGDEVRMVDYRCIF